MKSWNDYFNLDSNRIYTLEELTSVFNLTRATFSRYIRSGRIKAIKLGGRWLVRGEDAKEFIDSCVNYQSSNLVGQEVFNIKSASSYLGVTRRTLYRWIKKNNIFILRLSGKPYILKSEVERIKKERINDSPARDTENSSN